MGQKIVCCATPDTKQLDLAETSVDLGDDSDQGLPLLFPMYVIPARKLVELKAPLLPHEDMKANGTLVQHDPEKKVLLVSHQWLSKNHPDPKFEQFAVLQNVIKKLADGQMKIWKDVISEAAGSDIKVMSEEEQKHALDWEVWYDYFGCPQISDRENDAGVKDLLDAVGSIPAYVDIADYVMILAPDIPHADTGKVCNYASWGTRGWCLVERTSCVLSVKKKPLLVVPSSSTIYVSAGSEWISRFPGEGNFTVESDRQVVYKLTQRLLTRKCKDLRTDQDMFRFRVYTAMTRQSLKGFGTSAQRNLKLPDTLEKFLAKYFIKDTSEELTGGLTPLMIAAIEGNVPIIRELVASGTCDLESALSESQSEMNLYEGHTALTLASAFSTPESVATLLELGANVMAADTKIGVKALHIAAWLGNVEVMDTLVKYMPDGFDTKTPNFGITPLQSGCCQPKPAVTEKLLKLKADPNNGDLLGTSPLHTVLTHNTTTEHLELLLKHGADPNLKPAPQGPFVDMNAAFRQLISDGKATMFQYNFGLLPAPPLLLAALNGQIEHARVLIANKASLDATLDDGKTTALDIAEKYEQHLMRDFLLSASGSVNGISMGA